MLPSQIICQNRYQLIQQLGENQGRQTWLASDLSQGNQVVVKLLAFSPQMEWEQLKLFEREAEVLQRLNHPKIPKYRDYFSLEKEEGDGLCWFGLVQDFIPGISLQQLITQGKKFTESQIKDIATQVLEILIYLHKLAPQILHRDIKPSNLLLGEDNQIYLLDFGAVQNLGAVEGVTFTVVGTTGYAPLEQFWGKTVPSSDLYALGATIIHLLTGISPADLPQEKLRIKFADRVSVNRAFVQWVEGMTEPDPHQRYQTALSALKDLKAGRFLKDNFQLITSPFGEKVKLGKSHQELKIVLPIITDDKYQVLLPVLFIQLVLLSILGAVFLVITEPIMQILLIFLTLITTLLGYGLWRRSGIAWKIVKIVSIILFAPVIPFLFLCFLASSLSVLIFFPLSILICKVVLSLKRISSTQSSHSGYYVHFNTKKFVIEHKRAGRCLDRAEGKTPKINDCQLSDSAISILAGGKKYVFGDGVGERERKWIVTEIREWLQESKI
ncbi:MAG TPA: serine/threonine protein kinase [Microcoleaceae bacterium UBA11344]|nr:serine/threonine protein kinase [Microcoleaceae cyanobacterium UBA11344]